MTNKRGKKNKRRTTFRMCPTCGIKRSLEIYKEKDDANNGYKLAERDTTDYENIQFKALPVLYAHTLQHPTLRCPRCNSVFDKKTMRALTLPQFSLYNHGYIHPPIKKPGVGDQ